MEFRDRLIQFIRDRLQKSPICNRSLYAALKSLCGGNHRPRRNRPNLSRTVDLAESRLLLSGTPVLAEDSSADSVQPNGSSAEADSNIQGAEVNLPENQVTPGTLSQVISAESKHDSPQVARTGVPANQVLIDSAVPDLSFGSGWPDLTASGQVTIPDVDAVFTDPVFDLLDNPLGEIGGTDAVWGANASLGPLSSGLMVSSDEPTRTAAGRDHVDSGNPAAGSDGSSAQQSRSPLTTALYGQNHTAAGIGEGTFGITASNVTPAGNTVQGVAETDPQISSYVLPHNGTAQDAVFGVQPSHSHISINTSWMVRWFVRHSGSASHWFRQATSGSSLKFRTLGSAWASRQSASIAAYQSALLGISQPAESHPEQDPGSLAIYSVNHPFSSLGQSAEGTAGHRGALNLSRRDASVPSESRTLTEESTASRKQKLGDRQPQSLRKGLEASVELAPELPPIPDSGAGPRVLRYSINARAPPNHPHTPALIQLNRDVRAEQLERLRHSIAPRGPSLVSAETLHQVSSSVSGPKLSRNI